MSTSTLISRRAFIGMTLALAACKNRSQILELSGFSMGTTYHVVVVDRDGQYDKLALQGAIDSALRDVNQKLSNWDQSSEVSRFNAAESRDLTKMSSDFAQVMQTAARVHEGSEGRFDTSIGALIELWGFGAPGSQAMPNPDAVAQAMDVSGQNKTLTMQNGHLAKRQSDAQVYLAGIGKGYGADRIGAALAEFGIRDYMIEIGGDLYAMGLNPDGLPWQIGIERPNPADRSVMNVVGVSGKGLATSGDYRNYFEVDGTRYSHLIDPTTGYPVSHRTASATVLAEDAMQADAWSTAMLILGSEKGLEIAASQGVAVQFIDHDGQNGQPVFKTIASAKFAAMTA